MYIYIYIYILYIHIYYVCMYVCIYIYIYIYTYHNDICRLCFSWNFPMGINIYPPLNSITMLKVKKGRQPEGRGADLRRRGAGHRRLELRAARVLAWRMI